MDDIYKQVKFGSAVALTRVANDARMALKSNMQIVFDRPTRYALNSIGTAPAQKNRSARMYSRVFLKDASGKGIPAWKFLGAEISGGARRMKRFEIALQRIDAMPAGMMAVPGQRAPLDGYGNIKRGELLRILSYLGAQGEQGYKANRTQKSKDRLKRGTKKRQGVSYFVAYPGFRLGARSWQTGRKNHLFPGVYKRTHFARGSSIEPIILFVKRPTYERRFEYFKIIDATVSKMFERRFRTAVRAAIRNAK